MGTLTHFASNSTLSGLYQVKPNVVYSMATGTELTCTVIYPWATDYAAEKPTLPLVVFIQGSGWLTPDMVWELPQLCELARRGYVVAEVGHRNCASDEAPLPAALIDVKCAIRYLRKHAATYGIDPARVAVWGSSSGSHLAQLVGATADLPAFETSEHEGFSDAVSAVVACFGPSDIEAWWDNNAECSDLDPIRGKLFVEEGEEWRETARACSAITYVTPERAAELPPYLLGVGTADPWVETAQVTRMAEALEAVGVEASAFVVDDGLHEASFWSQPVIDHVWSFLDAHLAG